MQRVVIAAVAAVVASVTSVQAADLPAKAPYKKAIAYQVYDWSGFYAGVNVGGGVARNQSTFIAPAVPFPNAFNYGSPAGVIGGGQIGYNWQSGSLVAGLEADIQGSGMRDTTCALGCTTAVGLNGAYTLNQNLDWFGTVRARAGLATGPVFSYVTGGFAYGGVKTNTTLSFGGIGLAPTSISETRTGWTLGSGVEASLGGNWTGKIEYLYVDLGTQAIPNSVGGGTITNSEIREHIFRVGANYRMGVKNNYSAGPTANWSGLYAGLNAGTGLARNSSSYGPLGLTDQITLMPEGYLGGGQIGYNWQTANWVYGLETDFQGTSLKDQNNCLLACSAFTTGNARERLAWFGTVRGRLGYSVGSTLFYGTGGFAYGEVKDNVSATVFLLGTGAGAFKTTKTGWTAGGGMESPLDLFGMFGKNWTVKAEYLYVDLGSVNDIISVGGVPFALNTTIQEHVFRGGINYHFNSPVIAKY